MAAVQTQALTSHLRARDTRKVSGVGGGRGNIYYSVTIISIQRHCSISSIFNIYYYVRGEGTAVRFIALILWKRDVDTRLYIFERRRVVLIQVQWDDNNIYHQSGDNDYPVQRQNIALKTKFFIAFMGLLWNYITSD